MSERRSKDVSTTFVMTFCMIIFLGEVRNIFSENIEDRRRCMNEVIQLGGLKRLQQKFPQLQPKRLSWKRSDIQFSKNLPLYIYSRYSVRPSETAGLAHDRLNKSSENERKNRLSAAYQHTKIRAIMEIAADL